MKYDVAIIGGGPAGIAAAITLSRAGVSTILIEKKFYPREKTCAGILTQKTIYLLENEFSLSLEKQALFTDDITIMHKKGSIGKIVVNLPFALIERKTLDLELINICRKSGANIIEGVTSKLFPEYNKIVLSNNQSVTYNLLIIADGVFSPSCKQLGLENPPTAFCVQNVVDRNICPEKLKHLHEIQLNFGDVSLGYSWIVPYKSHIAVGTGVFSSKTDYMNLFRQHEEFCTYVGFPKISIRRGAYVPLGGFEKQIKHPYENIIITGDAAGLANPLTGEGIYHALLSGLYAAKSYLSNSLKYKSVYLEFLRLIVNRLLEQKILLPDFYNSFFLENILFQLKDCPSYL